MKREFELLDKDSSKVEIVGEKELEKLFNMTYLPHLEYADWRAEAFLRKRCRRAHAKQNIGNLALWLGKFHAREIKEARVPPCTIQWIDPIKGYGLFTKKEVKKWEFVGEYTGLVRRRRLFFPNVNDYCFMYPREWFTLKPYTIDSEKEGNFTRFINHSDYPNLESVAVFYEGFMHIIFRAIKDIPVGSEFTYDYGEIYWEEREKITENPS